MADNSIIKTIQVMIVSLIVFYFLPNCLAEEKRQIVVNGDRVEFFSEQKKVTAEGNVVIVYQDSKLTCDKVTVFSDTNDAIAEGNVHLYTPKGNLEGEKLIYNFTKKTGTIIGANLQAVALPFYGTGKTIEKFDDQHLEIKRGYLTTCDLAKPHYRLSSRKLEIYPGERIVIKDARFVIGKQTLFYFPRYTQVLNDKRPHVVVVPGYDKRWGFYILQAWRYYFNENSKGQIHLDFREKKDFASGIDYNYKIPNMGEGLIRTYYMNERNIQADRVYLERDSPTLERERFKAEWRHKWQIDNDTNAILQYYRLSDTDFIKDYFRRESEKVGDPNTFFLLTHSLPAANLSLDVEKRVNRFFAATERLPQLKFDSFSQAIGDTRFYFKSQNTYDNISNKAAQPSESVTTGKQTQRVDTYNEFSHQQRFGFIETRPYVGSRQTYFSRGNDPASDKNSNIIRGIFYSGIDLSTKFYRIFDTQTNFLNLDINRLRHIITPTVTYGYIHRPTIDSSKLINFDGIDTISRQNQMNFSLENKLQTKRGGNSVDILRLISSTDYLFKHDPEGSRFDRIKNDLELTPYSWLTASADTDYDTRKRQLETVNFDISASTGDEWQVKFGRRYQRKLSNEITAEFAYRVNPKWKFRAYGRYDSRKDLVREQEYSIIRDLHCWEMEMNYNNTPGLGNSIWIIFRIKAFPAMSFEFDKRFNTRKAGSQSSTGE